jgi:hypothetical protein
VIACGCHSEMQVGHSIAKVAQLRSSAPTIFANFVVKPEVKFGRS